MNENDEAQKAASDVGGGEVKDEAPVIETKPEALPEPPPPPPAPEPKVKCLLSGREFDADEIAPSGIHYRSVADRLEYVKAALASGRYHLSSESEFKQMLADADKALKAAMLSKFSG